MLENLEYIKKDKKTHMEYIFKSNSDYDTMQVAALLTEMLDFKKIVTLDGDLGVGKTVFAKGFAKALGVKVTITSPTFMIVKEYKDGLIPLFHFDLYRIGDVDELIDLGFYDYLNRDGILLIEWGQKFEEEFAYPIIKVRLEKNLGISEFYRKITINIPKNKV